MPTSNERKMLSSNEALKELIGGRDIKGMLIKKLRNGQSFIYLYAYKMCSCQVHERAIGVHDVTRV